MRITTERSGSQPFEDLAAIGIGSEMADVIVNAMSQPFEDLAAIGIVDRMNYAFRVESCVAVLCRSEDKAAFNENWLKSYRGPRSIVTPAYANVQMDQGGIRVADPSYFTRRGMTRSS